MSMAEAMKDHQSLDEDEGPVTASAVASAASAVSSAVALVAREEEGRRAAKMEAAAANGTAGRYMCLQKKTYLSFDQFKRKRLENDHYYITTAQIPTKDAAKIEKRVVLFIQTVYLSHLLNSARYLRTFSLFKQIITRP